MPTAAMRPSRLAVAMHEAGHAVVQLIDRDPPWLESVRLDGLGDATLGLVETGTLWKRYMEEARTPAYATAQWGLLAERDCIHLLAGPAAELKWQDRLSDAALRILGLVGRAFWFEGDPLEERSDLGQVDRRLRWLAEGTLKPPSTSG